MYVIHNKVLAVDGGNFEGRMTKQIRTAKIKQASNTWLCPECKIKRHLKECPLCETRKGEVIK